MQWSTPVSAGYVSFTILTVSVGESLPASSQQRNVDKPCYLSVHSDVFEGPMLVGPAVIVPGAHFSTFACVVALDVENLAVIMEIHDLVVDGHPALSVGPLFILTDAQCAVCRQGPNETKAKERNNK